MYFVIELSKMDHRVGQNGNYIHFKISLPLVLELGAGSWEALEL